MFVLTLNRRRKHPPVHVNTRIHTCVTPAPPTSAAVGGLSVPSLWAATQPGSQRDCLRRASWAASGPELPPMQHCGLRVSGEDRGPCLVGNIYTCGWPGWGCAQGLLQLKASTPPLYSSHQPLLGRPLVRCIDHPPCPPKQDLGSSTQAVGAFICMGERPRK